MSRMNDSGSREDMDVIPPLRWCNSCLALMKLKRAVQKGTIPAFYILKTHKMSRKLPILGLEVMPMVQTFPEHPVLKQVLSSVEIVLSL